VNSWPQQWLDDLQCKTTVFEKLIGARLVWTIIWYLVNMRIQLLSGVSPSRLVRVFRRFEWTSLNVGKH